MNIILLGGTGGIGKCLAYQLSKKNNLFISYTNKNKLRKLTSSIKETNNLNLNTRNISGAVLDVNNFNEIESFLSHGNKQLGSIDCIINCIGSLLLKPAHLTTEEELINTYSINVFSCFGILKYGFKFLKKNGGNIIFFSSAAAQIGLKNHDAIASAKAAVSSLALSASSTYARYNIRVNTIAPGLVDTPLTEKITSNQLSYNYSKNLHGLNKIGNPKNFIPIINSLIDKRSDWITGQTFTIDGGLSTMKG